MAMSKLEEILPKALTFTDQSYSLDLDMVLGWVPKFETKGFISLKFNNTLNDELIHLYQQTKLLYLGFRPESTLQLHKQYSSSISYPYKISKCLPKNQQIPFCGMNPDTPSSIVFDSSFEGGNLDLVLKVNESTYDLFMRVDSNTKGHTSWYNFKVGGLKKSQRITLNICNFSKWRSLYERGMKPYIYSNYNNQWIQGGENVQYQPKRIGYPVEQSKKYKCLSFELEGMMENETIQVAYCIPYTYTQMLQFTSFIAKNTPNVERQSLCETVSGVSIPILTFSDGNILDKKVFIVQSRVHPGESNGSWVMQGFLQFLMSDAAKSLLSRCIIKVIPMLNPDGVILGNYRTGCTGKDLNRRFKLTDPILFPEVYSLKTLVKEMYQTHGKNFMGFIDLHGHSVKKNVFLYGPEFPVWSPNYYKCRLLGKLLSQQTNMFRYFSCIYRVADHKRSTARGVFCDLYDLVNCFTVETSNGSYYDETKNFDFSSNNWMEMGQLLGKGLNQLVECSEEVDDIFGEETLQTMRKPNKNLSRLQNKKRSLTVYQEDRQNALKQSYQNSKYASIFEEMNNEVQQQSFSEGGSDSESDDDDYSDSQLEILRKEIIKQKPELKKYSFDKVKSTKVKRSFIANREKMAQTIQTPLLTNQLSEQKILPPYKKIQEVLKQRIPSGIKTFRATYNRNRKTFVEQIENPIDQEREKDKDEDEEFEIIKFQQNTQSIRPSTSKLLGENEFIPFDQQFQQQSITNSHHFKGHTRLKSNQSVKKILNQEKTKRKNPQAPLLTQLGIGQIQTSPQKAQYNNLEQLGILVKPKLFIQKKFDEQPEYYKNIIQGPLSLADNYRVSQKQKAVVPSSFYSVNKHLMNRQSVVRNKI